MVCVMSAEAAVESRVRIDLEALALRIVEEYREMPGLSVTAAQARRLWGLDHDTCEALLERMMGAGRLRLTKDGRYVSAERSVV